MRCSSVAPGSLNRVMHLRLLGMAQNLPYAGMLLALPPKYATERYGENYM